MRLSTDMPCECVCCTYVIVCECVHTQVHTFRNHRTSDFLFYYSALSTLLSETLSHLTEGLQSLWICLSTFPNVKLTGMWIHAYMILTCVQGIWTHNTFPKTHTFLFCWRNPSLSKSPFPSFISIYHFPLHSQLGPTFNNPAIVVLNTSSLASSAMNRRHLWILHLSMYM